MGRRSFLRVATTLFVSLVATALYTSTLMNNISGCAHEYCADVGEFQVALTLWGTVHHTGYPLYMLIGSPFVAALRLMGIPPATGASLYSTVWAVLAVGLLTSLVYRITKDGWLSGALGLLFATIEPIWIHGVIAEVYSLSIALLIGMLWLTVDLREVWSDKKGWLLAFVSGVSVAHHRLLALALLPISFFLLPQAIHIWRERSPLAVMKWAFGALLLFAAGFLPYLDIPLRIRSGTPWFYNRADTWDGFWHIFWAREVPWLMKPATTWVQWHSAFKSTAQTLISDLTFPGLVLIGLASFRGIGVRKTRPVAGLAIFVAAVYLLVAIIFNKAVLVQAVVMNAFPAFVILLGTGISSLDQRSSRICTALCLLWAIWLGTKNYPFVISLTRDSAGVRYINTVEKAEAPPSSVFMAPWGGNYFALAYAQRVEGRMAQWKIVDHRANYRELTTGGPCRVYTHFSTLYLFGPEWWAEKLGTPLRITSAGPEVVMLTAEPLEPLQTSGIPIGDGIVLDGWEVREPEVNVLHLVTYWGALALPSQNYSTFAYLTDEDEIRQPEDLIAQIDYEAPVYGWYPTSHWILYERIREDRVFYVSTDRSPRTIILGMYRRTSDGVFHHLGRITLKKDGQQWILNP